jgi:hypothetical protein
MEPNLLQLPRFKNREINEALDPISVHLVEFNLQIKLDNCTFTV